MYLGARLKEARNILKISQEELGRPFEFAHSKIRDLESGKQKITMEMALGFEEKFYISSKWLDTGEGDIFTKTLRARDYEGVWNSVSDIDHTGMLTDRPPEAFDIPPPSGSLPVISLAKGGANGFFEDAYPVGQGFMQIVRPHDITDVNAYAVMITGLSMYPMYDEGDIVVASPSHPVMNGKPVVVKLVSGEVMVKKYRKRNGDIVLESVNPEEKDIVVKPEEIVFTHRIVWKKEG